MYLNPIMSKIIWCYVIISICLACNSSIKKDTIVGDINTETVYTYTTKPIFAIDTQLISHDAEIRNQRFPITSIGPTPHELVAYAKTLIGIPYKYASIDPSIGFDCSGFITYVFKHFHMEVPRSSIDFTNVGKEVSLHSSKEGDLILFTGTVPSIRRVGHMGIVTENTDTLKFIHATSGRKKGVTISEFSKRYQSRFVKVIRII